MRGAILSSVPFPNLEQIPPEHIDAVWVLCAEFIQRGCKLGDVTPDELKVRCKEGNAQLWFAWSDHLEAALVTEIWNLPKSTVCVFMSIGGQHISRWLGLLDDVETWAKAQGATISRTFGRKGWGRILPDYKPRYFVYEKDLG